MPPSGGGQPYPASRDMTTPFPFGCLPAVLWDINPKEMGSLGAMEPAVEDTDGRSASDRTRPRFFFFGLCSTRSPYRGTGFRYRIRLLPGLACGILPDGTIPWLLNRDFKWSTQELDVRRGSVYG
nr:MAG TPA: hypothetical protein [Caudoviricetes sp.]